MNQVNIASIPVKAGEHVDMASPERMMEQVEREQLQAMADELHDRLIERVVMARPAVQQSAEEIFDGKIMTGEKALQMSLVDRLGYLDDAVGLARELSGLASDSSVVMLRRDNDRAYTLLDVTPNSPTMSSLLPLNVPGLDRQSLPTFLYMWQPESSMVSGN
jgi:protease-4